MFVLLFQNLIENALKYRNTRAPEIRITAEKAGEDWRVAVADNGIGIDRKFHDEIFGVFKRLHGPAYPGTGIGLAIVKRVVERCGGQIWVESEVGQGATFFFNLPFSDEAVTTTAPPGL